MSETGNQDNIREHYSLLGTRLWRNNKGVLLDKRGVPVRFGLANDTRQMSDGLKSGDLIGWTPRPITPDMVGDVIAQMTSIEVKPNGWVFPRPTNREEYAHAMAQLRWAEMVRGDGGIAGFMIDPLKGFEPI